MKYQALDLSHLSPPVEPAWWILLVKPDKPYDPYDPWSALRRYRAWESVTGGPSLGDVRDRMAMEYLKQGWLCRIEPLGNRNEVAAMSGRAVVVR